MLQSKLLSKTLRESPKDEVSQNAILLTRAGYVDKLMAGVYSYLPLGLRVLNKIKQIIRQEMNALGAQEILMPALTPKEIWVKSGNWSKIDVLFKLKGSGDKDYALGATHEEVVTPLVKKFAASYRDLPAAVYQIQDKFRDEPRAKSGLLRGREFSMKDLYSFHASETDLEEFYQKAMQAYFNVFTRCGLKARLVEASGGTFSKYSHEFQVLTESGEDNIVVCNQCDFAQNTEICSLKVGVPCPKCGQGVQLVKAIEVGNIFKLMTKFTKAFDYQYVDEGGKRQPVLMGCYGIGPSRIMGAVAEICQDAKGLIWPAALTPFHAHLLLLDASKKKQADQLYQDLIAAGYDLLYDDRLESAGFKLKDADLIGINIQLIVGEKAGDQVEYRFRNDSAKGKADFNQVVKLLEKEYVQ
ncbi:MAG: aminoacyl--tRNA ligase-related protein [Candidatus Komeilibacteria bacterium]|nr:aminoacyl--tRNA ligase-related protein [Candidatus Komeilibacteria bacterium]